MAVCGAVAPANQAPAPAGAEARSRAAALLDTLLHHSHTLMNQGESDWLKQAGRLDRSTLSKA